MDDRASSGSRDGSGPGAANYFEKIAMRREVVEAFVGRRPGLTAMELRDALDEEGVWVSHPYADLRWLLARGRVQALTVNPRTVLWFAPTRPAMPLRWEGDDA